MHFRAFVIALLSLIIGTSLVHVPSAFATTDTYTTPGTYTWTVPIGVTSADFEVWGGGGGGDNDTTTCADRGGGGGGYSKRTSMAVTPGDEHTVTVGAGGSVDNNGEASSVVDPSLLVVASALGGESGATGLGGSASSIAAIGTVKYSGGDSATLGGCSAGTGGGSSAGTGADGTDSVGTVGGAAPSGGGDGGTGGSAPNIAGTNGSAPGGGGGGNGGGFAVSGAGGAGRVVITYAGGATVSVSGTAYSDEGTTALASKTIAISINGAAAAATDDTDGSGAYSITGLTIASGDVLTLYIDGETEDAVTVTVGTGSNMTGINLYQNRLITRHDNSGSLTNSHLSTADNNGDADISAIYSVSSGALTVASGKELFVPTLHTFAPGGDVTTPTFDLRGTYTHSTETVTVSTAYEQSAGTFTSSSGVVDINGTFTLSGGTFNAPSGTFSVFGNWAKTGGTLNLGNTTVVFDGSSGTQTVNSGGTNFYAISHTGAGTVQVITNALTLDGAFSNSAGTFDANGLAATYTGLATLSGGTYLASTGTQTFQAGITVSGGTFTGSSGSVDVNGTLTLSSGTFTATSATTTVSGDWTKTGGTFTANSGSVHFDGTNQAISGSTTFHHFVKRDSDNSSSDETLTFAADSTQTITGTWTLDGADGNDRINLVSSSPGTQWNVDPQGTRTIDYIDVTDSKNTNDTSISCLNNCINGGNNTKWVFSIPPELVSFSSTTVNGTYGPGDTINITATYDEELDDPSTITLLLNNGVTVTIRSVSGSTLTGTYTVGAFGSGEDIADLTVESISSESVRKLDGGVIQDDSSLPEGEDNIGGAKNISIDTTEDVVAPPSSTTNPTPSSIPVSQSIVSPVGVSSSVFPSSEVTSSGDSESLFEPISDAISNILPDPFPITPKPITLERATPSTSESRFSINMPESVKTFMQESGALVAPVLAGAAVATILPGFIANSLPHFIQWIQLLGASFTIRRKKVRWGAVVDSDIGQPISKTVVQVFDSAFHQLKETQVTGPDGQFGFLLPPGKYSLVASQSGYVFPAKNKPPTVLRDGESLYTGQEFVITPENPEAIPHFIIPLDRQEEVSTGHVALLRFYQRVLSFVDRISITFLFIGALFNLLFMFIVPGTMGMVIMALYLVLFIMKFVISVTHTREIGRVLDAVTKQPVDLGLIRLYDAETNRIIQTRVTNIRGSFFLLVPKGTYNVSVSKAGYKTVLVERVHITGDSSKALAMEFTIHPLNESESSTLSA